MGPTMDNAILRDLFSACITSAHILGTDAAFAEQLRSGVVELKGAKVMIPERVNLKIEAEDDELEFAVNWGEQLGVTEDEEEEEIVYGGSEDDDDDDDEDSPYGDLDDESGL